MPCILATCIRNCKSHISKLKSFYASASKIFKQCYLVAIESDSTDGTDQALAHWASISPKISCISKGSLEEKYPERTARIAYCRNIYLEVADSIFSQVGDGILIVFDSDGVLSSRFIRSFPRLLDNTLRRASGREWFGITGITRPYYYDVWALRHPLWIPKDCLFQYQEAAKEGMPNRFAKHLTFQSKKLSLYGQYQLLEVESAFNGLAIYKWSYLRHSKYTGIDEAGNQICEHVPFHQSILHNHPSACLLIDPCLLIGDTPYERSPPVSVREAFHQLIYALQKRLGSS